MPRNNQQGLTGGGDFVPMSSIPERVGLPIEEIQRTGAELTNRYYQAKSAYFNIDATIKNKQLFDRETDQKTIDEVNAHISTKFKDIVNSDRWDQAAGTVMEVSRDIMTHKGLKAIDNAVATMQQRQAELNKRVEKEPNLRSAESFMKATALAAWRKQGGGLDKAGNIQGLGGWEPTTNMDISEEAKRIEDLASKMKPWTREHYKGLQTTVRGAVQEALKTGAIDQQTAMALTDAYDDKVGIAEVSADDVHNMAMNVVKNSTQFKTKLAEITAVEHFNSTGNIHVTPDEITNLYKGNQGLERNYSLNLSPTYREELAKIQDAHDTAISQKGIDEQQIKHIKNIYKAAKAKLDNNEALYNEGHQKLLGQITPEIENLYYNNRKAELTNSVLRAGDMFIGKSVFTDRKYLGDSNLYKALQDAKAVTPPDVTVNIDGHYKVDNNLPTLDPTNPANAQLENIKTAYENNPNPTQEQRVEYEKAMSATNLIKQGLLNSYNKIKGTPEEKTITGRSWKDTFSAGINLPHDTQAKYYDDAMKIYKQYKSTDVNSSFPRKDNLKNAYQATAEQFMSSRININDLLSLTPQQVYNKISKGVPEVSPELKQKIMSRIKSSTFEVGKQLTNTSIGSTILPLERIVSNGTITKENIALSSEVLNALTKGQLQTVDGVMFNPNDYKANGLEEGEYISFKPLSKDNLKTRGVNSESGFNVSVLNSNGGDTSGRRLYDVSMDVFDKENKYVRTINKQVYYDGGELTAFRSNVKDFSNLRNNIVNNKPENLISRQSSIATAQSIARMEGGMIRDADGNTMNAHIQALKNISNNGSTTFKTDNGTVHVKKTGDVFNVTMMSPIGSFEFPTTSTGDITTMLGAIKLLNGSADQEVGKAVINSVLTRLK